MANGDTFQIGTICNPVKFRDSVSEPDTSPPQRFTSTQYRCSRPHIACSQPLSPLASNFPPLAFQSENVAVQALYATGLSVDESDYQAIGAGLGSFVWADLLRLSGVRADKIVALGLEAEPYARYKRLCLNSQIPLYERLRSNSDSCPDNIWG